MALVIADRVKETSATTGTGALTLAGAITGFRAFSAACAVGDTLYYALQAVDASGVPTGDWECGLGTYSSANTLTRTTVTSSSNAGAAVSLAAGTKQVYISMPAVQVAWARERLTAARTYYVRTDGSDSNTGLANTAGVAFLTIQKAINAVTGLDIATYSVTIQLADGTYSGATVVNGPWLGSGTVTIQGNAATPANVLLTSSGATITASNGAAITLTGFKVTSTGNFNLLANSGAKISFSNLNIGACVAHQVRANTGASITCTGNYTISGGAWAHLVALESGAIFVQAKTVTISGTPAFSVGFCDLNFCGFIEANGNTFSGSATGKRYSVATNSVLYVAGAATTYLPGDTAGTTATGGQYA